MVRKLRRGIAESVALSYHAVAVGKVVLYFVGVAVVCSQGALNMLQVLLL